MPPRQASDGPLGPRVAQGQGTARANTSRCQRPDCGTHAQILHVNYEDIVSDLEGQWFALLADIGFPFPSTLALAQPSNARARAFAVGPRRTERECVALGRGMCAVS